MKKKLRNIVDTGVSLYLAHSSSSKYVCFDCRVCFHKPFNRADYKCPNCQKVMMYAGSAFRAPKKSNKKEWAKLEVLIRDGVRFHYYGGNGVLPATANEAAKRRKLRRIAPTYARKNSQGKAVIVKTDNKFALDTCSLTYRKLNYPDRYPIAQ